MSIGFVKIIYVMINNLSRFHVLCVSADSDLGRDHANNSERRGGVMNESFNYNERSDFTAAQRGSDRFAYAYENALILARGGELFEVEAIGSPLLRQIQSP